MTGSPVIVAGREVSRPKDTAFLYLDLSIGYWVYRNSPSIYRQRYGNQSYTQISNARFLTGFAPRFEIHYNRSLDSVGEQSVSGTGSNYGNVDMVNMTLGATYEFRGNKQLTLAWGHALTSGIHQDFQDEFRASFNWFRY